MLVPNQKSRKSARSTYHYVDASSLLVTSSIHCCLNLPALVWTYSLSKYWFNSTPWFGGVSYYVRVRPFSDQFLGKGTSKLPVWVELDPYIEGQRTSPALQMLNLLL